MPTFKEKQLLFGEMARELSVLLKHNTEMARAQRQTEIIVFAQAALVLVAFESFLRVLLEGVATDDHTLPNLLQMALAKKRRLFDPPAGMSRKDMESAVVDFRNSLLHGNVQQAAKRAGCGSLPEYLTGPFAAETARVYDILSAVIAQIDPNTGNRHR